MRSPRVVVLAKFKKLFGSYPEAEALLAELDRYGALDGEQDQGRARVQLAILKLSQGDPKKLRSNVAAALVDYRDVLAWAEYPEQMRSGATAFNSSEEEIVAIRKKDRDQYTEWLEGDS